MFEILYSRKFLKDAKLLKKRSPRDFEELANVLRVLADNGHRGLDRKHNAHKLSGYWECHVRPDVLLIWDENEKLMLLELVRTGTHSDLFD
ncbi:type II toxin-antitoxin system RelE/ParE family toxin [Dyadobacter frigoris]|uniref:Type II toxin-antitoxin system YafQ family toxin n=1 Tax=Dyadobacter frigoris TaxID=2576211 RepID=A0A4U6CT58_9BACT|nr:type II toxin-antitoxin system YafQ family toxin [Dyadobacter frigoris]TKT87386.1 type II toxin-antitoxin system YafQ family toxin [Dyadobacter frigoris]GLU55621.1 addiction module toxin, RelE/StbE family [Dyadobacter frigoris]